LNGNDEFDPVALALFTSFFKNQRLGNSVAMYQHYCGTNSSCVAATTAHAPRTVLNLNTGVFLQAPLSYLNAFIVTPFCMCM
jgi:hypothetical protein